MSVNNITCMRLILAVVQGRKKFLRKKFLRTF